LESTESSFDTQLKSLEEKQTNEIDELNKQYFSFKKKNYLIKNFYFFFTQT